MFQVQNQCDFYYKKLEVYSFTVADAPYTIQLHELIELTFKGFAENNILNKHMSLGELVIVYDANRFHHIMIAKIAQNLVKNYVLSKTRFYCGVTILQ